MNLLLSCPSQTAATRFWRASIVLAIAGAMTLATGCAGSNGYTNIGTITTVAGDGTTGDAGDGGPAASAGLNQPSCAVTDSAENLYIGDASASNVRKVAAGTGIITLYAGNGQAGYSGDGGPAVSASLAGPASCALDSSGNLFIADTGNNVIRKVAASSGIITTVAGVACGVECTFSGDGGPAIKAQLYGPWGVVVDAAGDLFISDTGNERVREVSGATGIITTIVGNGTPGNSGNGGPATAAEMWFPEGLALDPAGANLYIAEQGRNVIAKVNLTSGVFSIVAGNGTLGSEQMVTGDGGPATSAPLCNPQGVAVDRTGNIFIADSGDNRVRMVSASTGIITSVVGSAVGYSGDGGPSDRAQVHYPWGLSVDASGDLYIADAHNSVVRKVTP